MPAQSSYEIVQPAAWDNIYPNRPVPQVLWWPPKRGNARLFTNRIISKPKRMKKIEQILIVLSFFALTVAGATAQGKLTGMAVDAETQEPLSAWERAPSPGWTATTGSICLWAMPASPFRSRFTNRKTH